MHVSGQTAWQTWEGDTQPAACSQVLALFAMQVIATLQTTLQQLPVLPTQGLHLGQQLAVLLLLGTPQLRQQL